jgi:hypothetical protein
MRNSQLTPSNNMDNDTRPTVFNQTGNKNTQIAHANNVNQVINIILPSITQSTGGLINSSVSLNREYYNLFVIGEEDFQGEHFIVPKERALTESMSVEAKELFSSLSDDAIAQIITFPSLFASENHQYGRTDDQHIAYFGLITNVKIQDNGIKIYFYKLAEIPQQKLNEISIKLALERASSLNELNRTHWAIKRIDLIEELWAAGISVLAPR